MYQKGTNQYKSIVGNTFEALYGAVFFDLGYEKAQKSIEEYILSPQIWIKLL